MPFDEPEYVEFSPADVRAVVRVMARMTETHAGWINFEPAVRVEDVPPPRDGLFGLFAGRGPDVPVATWTPGEARKGRVGPPTIGLLHAAGGGARAKLSERGHPVPEGWVVLQDYSKKGLVVAVPPAVGHAQVIAWLLRAAGALTAVPLTGEWRAAVYEP